MHLALKGHAEPLTGHKGLYRGTFSHVGVPMSLTPRSIYTIACLSLLEIP